MSARVIDQIAAMARVAPEHLAVKDLDRELSYGELLFEVSRVGAGLVARGVVAGDRVALLLPNSVDFVVAALASQWVGAAFVPLAISDPLARLSTIVADCEPAMVIVSDARDDALVPSTPLGWSPVEAISALYDAPSPVESLLGPGPRVAYIIYTSGTTGTPKGVMIGDVVFAVTVHATAEAVGLNRATRTLCVSPFHFDGSFGSLFTTLYAGGSVIIRPRDALLFPRTFFNAIAGEQITYASFSPSYLRLILASRLISTLETSTLETVALGGEASSITDLRTLWALAPRIRVFNRYGPTETTIAVTHVRLTPETTADGRVPVGSPHVGVTLHLVDDEGLVVSEPERVGELYIGGHQLMDGYWREPALSAEVLRSDVVPGVVLYRTGDLVYQRKDGNYVYVDRVDRVIKRSGVRISLVELSEAMRSLDHVTTAVCLTYNNGGELGIVAFVVVDESVTALDLRRSARELLPDTMLPNQIELVDALPLTASNKLDERLLLDQAGLRPLLRSSATDVTRHQRS